MSGLILVAGSLHYDVIVNAPRLPHRDETIIGDAVTYVCGGKGGNQAVAASRHGAEVAFAGRVGRDQASTILTDNLRRAGVDVSQVQIAGNGASGMSVAIVDESGDYGAVVVSAANLEIDATAITVPEETRLVILQNEIPHAVNLHVAHLARARGANIMLNAAPWRELPDDLAGLVDIMIVNRVEAAGYFGASADRVEDWQALANNHTSAGPPDAIITLGGDGLIHHRLGAPARHEPPVSVDVISSHGAGDVFVGALAARLVSGDGTDAALAYAQASAALFVSTPVEEREAIGAAAVRGIMASAG